jgi:hypothetical protein
MAEERPRFRTGVGKVTGPVHTSRSDIIVQQAPVPVPAEAEQPPEAPGVAIGAPSAPASAKS